MNASQLADVILFCLKGLTAHQFQEIRARSLVDCNSLSRERWNYGGRSFARLYLCTVRMLCRLASRVT